MDQKQLQIVLQARDEASKTFEKLDNALNGLTDTSDKFTKKSKSLGEILKDSFGQASIVSSAALAGLTAEAYTAVNAFMESERVVAQTEAVIKSTGGAAKMSADQIGDLAVKLQNMTGVSDETIQTGENLLLTFTKIGKDIFPQATETMMDMSVALGQDVKASAIQLGKALNDPINGATALRRVGVSLTDSQIQQIKVFQQSGQLMKAQNIILKELHTEFGGAAKAAGETFSGKLNILRESFGNLQETIGGLIVKSIDPLIPKFQNTVTALGEVVNGERDVSYLTQTLTKDFGALGEIIGSSVQYVVEHKDAQIALAGAVAGVLTVSIIGATVAMMGFIGVSLPVIGLAAAIGAGIAYVATHMEETRQTLQNIAPEFLMMIDTLDKMGSAIAYVIFETDTFKSREQLIVEANKNQESAVRDHWAAVTDLNNALRGVNDAELNLESSQLRLERAHKMVADAVKVHGANSLEAREARVNLKRAENDVESAIAGVNKKMDEAQKKHDEAIKKSNDVINAQNKVKDAVNGQKTAWDNVVGAIGSAINKLNDWNSKVMNASKGTLGFGVPGMRFADGGYVPYTGTALVHEGEYVLSRAMLEGRQPIAAPIKGNTTSNSTVIENVNINHPNDVDAFFRALNAEFVFNTSY